MKISYLNICMMLTVLASALASPTANNLIAVMKANPELSMTLKALEAAGVTSTFENGGPYTFFAPTNKAFAEAQRTMSQQTSNLPDMKKLIKAHGMAGSFPSKKFTTGQFRTLSEAVVNISVDGNRVTVNGVSIGAELGADNGVVYIIDHVLMPSTFASF